MSILVTPNTKVLVQGITGSFGAKHAQLSIDYGTHIVAGVTPGKGGQFFEHGGKKIPIFDTVADAVKQTVRLRARYSFPRPSPPMPFWKARMPASNSSSPSPKAFPCAIWCG